MSLMSLRKHQESLRKKAEDLTALANKLPVEDYESQAALYNDLHWMGIDRNGLGTTVDALLPRTLRSAG